MAAKGYPGTPYKGSVIAGLAEAAAQPGAMVFHAGTAMKGEDVVANGGRVLGIVASGETATLAQQRAYQAVDRVNWPDGFCRRDIGWRAVERETSAN
jgi:phosphoribosylamine--glycine ligase